MDVTSFLLAEWVLWLRGAIVSAAGYFLCRRRSYGAVPVVLLAAYWAYNSLSFMVEFRAEVLEQVGLGYVVQASMALLMPFAFMSLGLFFGRKHNAEQGRCSEPALRDSVS
jgi:hypothetical protein